jgi:hypothetical protein
MSAVQTNDPQVNVANIVVHFAQEKSTVYATIVDLVNIVPENSSYKNLFLSHELYSLISRRKPLLHKLIPP